MMYSIFKQMFLMFIHMGLMCAAVKGQGHQAKFSRQSFRKVCYFTNWSCDLLVKEAHFCLRHIDINLCTHLVYAFAGINATSLTLSPTRVDDETKGDIKGRYVLFNELKAVKPELKTLLSVGGSYQTEMFLKVATLPTARSQFAYNSALYVRKWGFDGLDLDWEYPQEDQKDILSALIQDLRLAFLEEAELTSRSELVLSFAAPASDEKVKAGYDVNSISQHVDMINLMAYDFYGSWGGITGFNSPLYPRASDTRISHKHCVEWSVNLWIHLGAPPHKINLGIAAYGQSFTLDLPASQGNGSGTAQQGLPKCNSTLCAPGDHADTSNVTGRQSVGQANMSGPFRAGSKTVGPGKRGRLRHFNGQLSYQEICENALLNNGQMFWDEEQQVPYITYDDQWISFDDVRSVAEKVKWAIGQRLGGVMFWSLDLDDFSGEYCGEGRFPLLTSAHSTVTCMMQVDINSTGGKFRDICPSNRHGLHDGNYSLYELLTVQSGHGSNLSGFHIGVGKGRPNTTHINRNEPMFTQHSNGSRVGFSNENSPDRLKGDGHVRAGPKGHFGKNGTHHRRRNGPKNEPNIIPVSVDNSETNAIKDGAEVKDFNKDSLDFDDLGSYDDFNNYYYYIAFKADRTTPPDTTRLTSKSDRTTVPQTVRPTTKTTTKTTKRPITTTTEKRRTTLPTKTNSIKDKSGIPSYLKRNVSMRIFSNCLEIISLLFICFLL